MPAADTGVVEPSAQHRPDGRRDHGYPPPAVARPEDLRPPAGQGGEEARPEVARRIDGIPGVEAERRSDGHDQQPDNERPRPAAGGVFRASVRAQMTAISRAVPTTWSTTPPGSVLRNGWGYVAQIPAVPCGPRT